MLEGKAIENHSLVLLLEGLQIPRLFRAPLRDRTKCTLQLPGNWCNDFCGFLICAVLYNRLPSEDNTKITMKQVRGGSMGMDTQDGVDWKESVDDKRTWVGYVSFGSLRHTAAWLDETGKAVSFSMPACEYRELCHGFGVSLIPRTSGSGPMDASSPEYHSHIPDRKINFKPKFIVSEYLKFKDDLTCTFQIPSALYE
nr:Toll/interleukin-1 receptor (TIR) domain-containing protein [Tanacetum cinerariifolium]